MSVYTAIMALAALVTALAHKSDWFSVMVVGLTCVPFFFVPGLTDVQYLPIERNSPVVGGALAFAVAVFLIYRGQESWHLLIAALFGVFMVWSGFRSLEGISQNAHALGLETIFYTMMALGVSYRFEVIRAWSPDLVEWRDRLTWLRIG